MIDLFYLTHNRFEFTRESVAAMIENTDWALVNSISLYDDESSDGTWEFLQATQFPVETVRKRVKGRSPVAAMNEYIVDRKSEMFCKVDNDVMLPAGWLADCLSVMDRNPGLDILGIEAMRPMVPAPCERGIQIAPSHVGGIGLMRGRAFQNSLPRPDGRFGFTGWQDSHEHVSKAWLNPALPVFLLDKIPFAPWCDLSGAYVAKRWQRPWDAYGADRADLWSWWKR